MINKKKVKLNKAEQATGVQSPKRVSRKTLRRRRIIKRALGMLGIVLVAAAAIFAAMKLLFVVRTTEVKGSEIFTAKEITDFIAIPEEENIFRVKSDEIEQLLVEEFTYIDNVQVIKRLPDRIEINVEDSTESFFTTDGEKYTVYSQSFKKLRNSTEPPVNAVWLDIEMDNEEKMSLVKNMLDLFSKYEQNDITKISVSDENMIKAVYDNRIEIDFGTVLDIDYKIKMCKKILDEKIPEEEKGTIDATEGGEVVYKRQ
ncbi:MAG: FtsQ-type POTRA domain-containing protein [Ruminococcaceae bacterium]|nr:FtsQ-type POTRA domain-containing protein [Oscillospiraceae bacterium]